jgi:hypothetical protein
VEAVARDSVLDAERVGALLAKLPLPERRRAVQGLKLLADAAQQLQEEKG